MNFQDMEGAQQGGRRKGGCCPLRWAGHSEKGLRVRRGEQEIGLEREGGKTLNAKLA